MKRPDDLERLIALRRLRLDRAAIALAEATTACETARGKVAEAGQAAAANGERRLKREEALIGRLAMRPLTLTEIGRARDALETMEQEAQDIDRAEQEARRAFDAELERRREASAHRLRLERERDKLTSLAGERSAKAARRADLFAELDAEELYRPGAAR
jgi:hypothetical protein